MTFTRWDAVRHALTIAGLAYIAAVWLRLVPYAEPVPSYGPMFDAYGIWNAWSGGLYDIPWLDYEAYVYSPAFAQIIYPFTLLPWELFAALWTGLAIGILFWMRVPWMLAFPGVMDDILRGNIHVFLAGAVFLALRARPWGAGAWAFAFLTKVTPGIGVVWHAVRGEWRRFGIALGVTAAIVAVSVLTVPDLWREWINLLAGNDGRDAADPGHSPAPGRAAADRAGRGGGRGLEELGLAVAHRGDAGPAQRVDQLPGPAGGVRGAVGRRAAGPIRRERDGEAGHSRRLTSTSGTRGSPGS